MAAAGGNGAEDAWWDSGAPPAAESAEKGKKSRWGRNKDKDAGAERDDAGNADWAAEATTRWDRGAAKSDDRAVGRNEERPAGRNDDWDRRGEREAGRRNDDGAGWGNRGESIPEQRKREVGAFEDLAPLELNLDEEPKEKTSRRFLRRK
ncbi:hypothetical protein [Dactylosporangium sp. NPDC051541]|uniref:hypothetical protein n=1 Tax=Dactylosporangium sp. NPDC051541 TaxID=3363977 RepID=UPI00378A8544